MKWEEFKEYFGKSYFRICIINEDVSLKGFLDLFIQPVVPFMASSLNIVLIIRCRYQIDSNELDHKLNMPTA